jgi:hypothetical protein
MLGWVVDGVGGLFVVCVGFWFVLCSICSLFCVCGGGVCCVLVWVIVCVFGVWFLLVV